MSWYEQRISGFGSDCSIHCATTMAHLSFIVISLNGVNCCFSP